MPRGPSGQEATDDHLHAPVHQGDDMTAPTRVPGSADRPADIHDTDGTAAEAPAFRSRAMRPDLAGVVERDGVNIAWAAYGTGSPTILLLPTWSIVHSRVWKLQVPYLARHYRVLTFDGRGNGASDRPAAAADYAVDEFAADALAVMDATDTQRAVLVGLSMGAQSALTLASAHPERVLGIVFIGASLPVNRRRSDPRPTPSWFDREPPTNEGWNRYNRHSWRRDYDGFLDFFFAECLAEPHSTKPIEDCVEWGHETDAETLILTEDAPEIEDRERVAELAAGVRCPVLVVHGTEDRIRPFTEGAELAELTGGTLLAFEGSGHLPLVREPVRTNLAIRGFVASQIAGTGSPRNRSWTRAPARRRRALYLSSPIGLGHAQRDVAIAAELRAIRPDLEIDWLAQHPVTTVLEARDERINPLSAALSNESAHFAAESTGHSLNAFQAVRRMDEILVANFMVFHEAVESGDYDLVIGDESWDVDHYLHENPELKRTAFAWLTDFVGWLPMPAGGEREAFLTADYNAEMIEHIERFPRIRDRAIFVGDPEDIVPDQFGPGMPAIRDWTERHYDFSGYVTGFDPAPLVAGREEIRRELGYHDDERVVVVTVGGSGVGQALLRRVIAAYPEARRRAPGLRLVAVAGPRIEPASLNAPPGVEVLGYVPDLYRHLAAADLAVVQGGLTTTMELVAARVPFLYFPLGNHFEQLRHVRHRLDRYGAGRAMDYATSTPDVIATAIAEELDRPVAYRPVASDGARRAAALIADLV